MSHVFASDNIGKRAVRATSPARRPRPLADRHEREADAIAARMTRSEAQASPPARLQPVDARAGSALSDAPVAVTDVLRTPGRPLDAASRGYFEPRFGRDFADVRVHDDAGAAHSARSMSARAYTSGSHVVFAAGRHAPHTSAGRELMAHELSHVVQQRNASTDTARVQCAPEESAADVDNDAWLSIGVSVTTLPGQTASHSTSFQAGASAVDLSGATLYTGDVFDIAATDPAGDAADTALVVLPFELEATAQSTPTRTQLRVVGGPATGAAPIRVKLSLLIGSASEVVQLTLAIHAPPSTADVTPESMERNEQALTDLKADRRRARRDHRALPGAERRARRKERREERRGFRRQRRDLLEQRDTLERRHGGCDLEDLRLVEAALARAIAVSDAALGRLGRNAGSDPAVKTAMASYFKLSDDLWATQAPGAITRVRDTLATARNSMASASPTQFSCQGPTSDCDDTTGAFVTQHDRGSPPGLVTLCPLWLSGTGLKFDPATGLPDNRAYALLHEFAHLSGATTGGKERYVSGATWKHVSAADAVKMADAYAAIAWTLGAGGGP